jgi:hypothetical protein
MTAMVGCGHGEGRLGAGGHWGQGKKMIFNWKLLLPHSGSGDQGDQKFGMAKAPRIILPNTKMYYISWQNVGSAIKAIFTNTKREEWLLFYF